MRTYIAMTNLALLAAASPLSKRAGAPSITPIPANCTLIDPIPHATCGSAEVSGYKPRPAFVTANLLYEAYFPSSLSPVEQAKQCSEQCYGYGTKGQCKSAFTAYKVPTPTGYAGGEGGNSETACLLFSEYPTPLDFIPSAEGHYVTERAANIYCPS